MNKDIINRIRKHEVGKDHTTVQQALLQLGSTALQLLGPISASKGSELISWKLGSMVAGAAGAAVAAGGGAALSILTGLARIGKMNELGRDLASRNAWKDGFASTLAAMANNQDWNPTLSAGSELGKQQMLGRNAAITLVKILGPETGSAFLSRYEGFRGKDQALKDLGGYRV